MDTYMHKTMVSIGSLEKIEILRSQEFMPSKVRLKFLKKMIILGPKLPFWGLNFVEFWCWGLIFGGHGGPGPPGSPLDPPLKNVLLDREVTILPILENILLTTI